MCVCFVCEDSRVRTIESIQSLSAKLWWMSNVQPSNNHWPIGQFESHREQTKRSKAKRERERERMIKHSNHSQQSNAWECQRTNVFRRVRFAEMKSIKYDEIIIFGWSADGMTKKTCSTRHSGSLSLSHSLWLCANFAHRPNNRWRFSDSYLLQWP